MDHQTTVREEILHTIRGRNQRGGVSCLFCTSPVRELLQQILDTVIETQDVVSVPGILETLKLIQQREAVQPVERTAPTLRFHMVRHDTDRWDQLNLIRRGPLNNGGA